MMKLLLSSMENERFLQILVTHTDWEYWYIEWQTQSNEFGLTVQLPPALPVAVILSKQIRGARLSIFGF